uniref:Uncharacterized protein n=1 Tax=Lepeophtheirus salmonis TaxID=72036 RepID=A0A0K2TDF7_LEPSM
MFGCDVAAVLLIHSVINGEKKIYQKREKTFPQFLLALREFRIFFVLSNLLSYFCSGIRCLVLLCDFAPMSFRIEKNKMYTIK